MGKWIAMNVYLFGLLILIALIITIIVFYRFFKRTEIKKRAIRNRKHSNAKGKQTCSYCKKKASPLTFYADRNGKVVGVCKVCRVQAERQALMRI
jgi:hypothetical protein